VSIELALPFDVEDVPPFDVCGPLPEGTTVLEASAGTGKTFTIAALATRYVAEGHAELAQIMLVTFSRAATQELRERVRDRLVATERGLADPRAARESSDALLRLLAGAPDEEVARRRHRLTRALAGFDAATIATTHGFCQQMLAGLGVAGDTDPDATFVESIDDLVTEVVDDLYLRSFAGPAVDGTAGPAVDGDPLPHSSARAVARQATQDRHARLVPDDAGEGSPARQRVALALAVRREVEARKRVRKLLDYDDLLTRLRDALCDPVRGQAARERIRSRYRFVLVDEFQDTDPVQWEILRAAFHGTTTLVLIGDPKQAIYAFRGADLVTYLTASAAATTRRTLARNWRSDAPLLTALQHVFGGAALGDPRIVVRPVDAQHPERRVHGQPLDAPLRLRVMGCDAAGKQLPVKDLRPLVARDLAADIVGVLTGRVELTLDGRPRPVQPGDVAVLVHTNDQAALVREALAAANVPAVLTGNRSVYSTAMARDWLTLLTAIEQPHRAGLVRAVALTRFVGWSASRLATAEERALDELGERVRQWRDVLVTRGVAALLEVVASTQQLTARALAAPGGERELTDLRHIGEELHAVAAAERLGPAALVQWLERRITEAAAKESETTDERSRRLESDADAVQVVTIHSSKGLEFPLAYVPFGWDRFTPKSPEPLRLHTVDGTRLLDVGGAQGPGYRERLGVHQEEESGETLRTLYVALTRAQCHVVAWWAPSHNTRHSALHRLLFAPIAPGEQPAPSVPVPADDEARRHLEAKAAASSGTLAVERVQERPLTAWTPPPARRETLAAAVFARSLDAAWRRTSYTGLTAALHGGAASGGGDGAAGVGSEPEVPERRDEADVGPGAAARTSATDAAATDAAATTPASAPAADAVPDADAARAVPSPMADLPTGAAFGTLVHDVLERTDTAAADLPTELGARCAEAVAARLASGVDPAALAAALLPVLETPLGPLAGEARLRDIPRADRLAEMAFELPLAGGDEPRAADATLARLGEALRAHLPPGDALAGYAAALAEPGLGHQRLRGYLTGSIDAVLRVRAGDGQPRHVVVDYKTNWLGGFGPAGPEPLTAWHYRPAALTDAMVRAHYPLQALLYTVALHRFLRWRQPGYDPGRHLGGVLYLFVRGMSGPATPTVGGAICGVFSWAPPPALVEELSRLLDGSAS